MSRWCISLLVPVLAIGCTCPPQTERGASAAHVDVRGFKVVSQCSSDPSQLDSLVRFIEQLKSSGHDIDRVTRIRFVSRRKAMVDFLWSGGFHAGELEVVQGDGAWTLVQERYDP